ncbi:type II toxin-antitoxin system HicA family toxin [uncultured Ilyobacter sp.]|uniref:type II toxin-antitoxin system HicA family toxin n=1 Tax=uncultured Ilyobacter sp. TaxID=544433 RepID=UPI0029C0BF88|nr:type II toxin-antitoxin system HicA family toxin [uncultured Ilyobacter sp.]
MTSKEIIKRLKSEGWELVSQAGSHTKWKHSNGGIVIVPHPRKDISKGTLKSIFKQAGWE